LFEKEEGGTKEKRKRKTREGEINSSICDE